MTSGGQNPISAPIPARIRVAVIDSGINPRYPRLHPTGRGRIGLGIGLRVSDGEVRQDDDTGDRLGHGTAVAAAIFAAAPDVELVPVRIFRRRLKAHTQALLRALEWSVAERFDVVNLSLGCRDMAWREPFQEICREAARGGVIIVAAALSADAPSLPGCLEGTIGVVANPELEPLMVRRHGKIPSAQAGPESVVLEASPFAASSSAVESPLKEERVPRGTSLAVANVTGLIAQALGAQPRLSLLELTERLDLG